MPALLATLRDLLIGLGIGIVVALVICAAIYLYGLWLRQGRLIEEERLRREPEPPVDFHQEIANYLASRERNDAGERRAA